MTQSTTRPQTGDHADDGELKYGHTSLAELTLFGISAQQIGPGLALAGGYMIFYAGDASWLSMLIALLISFCLGAIIIAFSRRFVATGGLMSYVSTVLGPVSRALTASGYLLGLIIASAAVTTGVVIYTASFMVQLGLSWAATPLAQAIAAVVVAVVAGFIAFRGLDASVIVTTILSFVGLPFIAWVTIAAAIATPDYSIASQFDFTAADFSLEPIFQGTIVALAYFVGVDGLAAMASETKDPQKNLPRFIVLLLAITGIAFVVALWFQIPVLRSSFDALAGGESPTALMAHIGDVDWLAVPLDLLMAAATFAGLIGVFNYGSRILGTAAKAGILPRRISYVNRRYSSPANAVLLLVILSAGLPILLQVFASAPPLESSVLLYTLFSYCYFVPYVIGAIAAIVLVIRESRWNALSILTFVIAGGSFAFLLFYALFLDSEDGVFAALPWISSLLTLLLFFVLLVVQKRNPHAGKELTELL